MQASQFQPVPRFGEWGNRGARIGRAGCRRYRHPFPLHHVGELVEFVTSAGTLLDSVPLHAAQPLHMVDAGHRHVGEPAGLGVSDSLTPSCWSCWPCWCAWNSDAQPGQQLADEQGAEQHLAPAAGAHAAAHDPELDHVRSDRVAGAHSATSADAQFWASPFGVAGAHYGAFVVPRPAPGPAAPVDVRNLQIDRSGQGVTNRYPHAGAWYSPNMASLKARIQTRF